MDRTEAPPAKPPPKPKGVVCRKCECPDLRVIRTTKTYGGKHIRTRLCRHCGHTFKTTEIAI